MSNSVNSTFNSANITANIASTISVSIGARFEQDTGVNETAAATVSILLDTLMMADKQTDVIEFLLKKGLYAFAAEQKMKNKPESIEDFQDVMHEISANMVYIASQSETKRGRAATDYPQAMRAVDYKIIKKFQLRMLEREELIRLPKDFESWIKPSYLAKIEPAIVDKYVDGLLETIENTNFMIEPGEREAIIKLTSWITSTRLD